MLNKINADYYHAGLSNSERNGRQENWVSNNTRIIACTNAFGMGIDKPDVRTVIHYGVPDCLENYYQEAGRAGRDGKKAYAVLLYNNRELEELKLQADIRYPGKEEIKKIYTAVMNYLQVPAGSGEGISYNFDLAGFSKAFNINILSATYALKAMEQEDILQFNEVFFKPSTLVFTTGKDDLQEFENQFPQLEPLIKGLLRSYEGIFDYPATIYENELSKFLGKKPGDVQKELQLLKHSGIIDYSPQKDTPQITLVMNRMYSDSFFINLENYLKRKQSFESRVKAMTDFINEAITCRSQLVGAYFNDRYVKPCGVCDNCLNQKNLEISIEEFEKITAYLLEVLKTRPLGIRQLLTQAGRVKKEKMWKVLNFLQSEQKLHISRDGDISLNEN